MHSSTFFLPLLASVLVNALPHPAPQRRQDSTLLTFSSIGSDAQTLLSEVKGFTGGTLFGADSILNAVDKITDRAEDLASAVESNTTLDATTADATIATATIFIQAVKDTVTAFSAGTYDYDFKVVYSQIYKLAAIGVLGDLGARLVKMRQAYEEPIAALKAQVPADHQAAVDDLAYQLKVAVDNALNSFGNAGKYSPPIVM